MRRLNAGAISLAIVCLMAGGASGQDNAGQGETRAVPKPSFRPTVVTNPEWDQKPTAAEMGGYYPAEAARRGFSGGATILCIVSDTGFLRDCKVTDEHPKGYGFGAAALAAGTRFRMHPQTRDGAPVGGARVSIPINFVCPGCTTPDDRETDVANRRSLANAMLANVTWVGGPSFQQWASAYPERALEQGLSGSATVRCKFDAHGGLKTCRILSKSPRAMGFGRAAVSLSKYFIGPDKVRGVSTENASVDYNVNFPIGLPRGGMSPLTDTMLWQVPSAGAIVAAFPEAAKAAGVAYGEVYLSCERPDQPGPMTCKVASETPEGMGFGEAALSLAPRMAANVWAADGRPTNTDITVPIAFGTAGPEQQS